eukprot:12925554-Prorocentrum_lima.AAC.1
MAEHCLARLGRPQVKPSPPREEIVYVGGLPCCINLEGSTMLGAPHACRGIFSEALVQELAGNAMPLA